MKLLKRAWNAASSVMEGEMPHSPAELKAIAPSVLSSTTITIILSTDNLKEKILKMQPTFVCVCKNFPIYVLILLVNIIQGSDITLKNLHQDN